MTGKFTESPFIDIDAIIRETTSVITQTQRTTEATSQIELISKIITDQQSRAELINKLEELHKTTDQSIRVAIKQFGSFVAEALSIIQVTRADIGIARTLPITGKQPKHSIGSKSNIEKQQQKKKKKQTTTKPKKQ